MFIKITHELRAPETIDVAEGHQHQASWERVIVYKLSGLIWAEH